MPDDDFAMPLGNVLPVVFSDDFVTSLTAESSIVARREQSCQRFDVAGGEKGSRGQSHLPVSRNIRDQQGRVSLDRLQHHHGETFQIRRMNEEGGVAEKDTDLVRRQGACEYDVC
jgi:hypothetical protein